jgi:CHASE3 domain sensor protein
VVLKCLEKDPLNRYQSMMQLHADLERIQSGKKISARVAKEDPLLTQSMIFKITLAVLINILVLTLTVGQYDSCIKEKVRAQSFISSANALSKLLYDAGVAMGGYSITKSPLFKDRYSKIREVIPEEIDSLRTLSSEGDGEGGRESPAFKSIERDAQTSIKILDEARTEIGGSTTDQAPFKARHMYKEIRLLADDLQAQLRILTAGAHRLSSDPNFNMSVKLTLIGELLLLFLADVLFTIRMMREVQRAAQRRVWKIKQEK